MTYMSYTQVCDSTVPLQIQDSPSFVLSSSVVAKPFISFCLAAGGGVGGSEAGGVGGLLRLF